MSAQSVGLGSMFGWIPAAFRLVGSNVGAMLIASLVSLGLLLLMLLPMVIAMAFFMPGLAEAGNAGAPPTAANPVPVLVGYGVMMVAFFGLYPPLMIGWFRVCQHIDRGQSVRGLDVLRPYADGQLWLRALRFALLALLVYIGVFALFALAFGNVFGAVMQQAAAQQAAALSGASIPATSLPSGFFLAYALMMVLSLLLQVAYMLGFAEISLRQTTALEAMKLAGAGTARNALKLLLFFMCTLFLLFVGVFVVALVLALVIGGLALLSPTASVVAAVLLYLPVFLLMYPLLFAGHYLVWKSTLGGDPLAGPTGDHEQAALVA